MNKQLLLDEFTAEIDEVQSTLLAATNAITSPLDELVRAQIKRSNPPICAAVVLAVAISPTEHSEAAHLQAGDELRRKRILLAAALQMLHVALNVHRLLVNAAQREQQSGGERSLDPSFIGSTILAGDYCFSRAAEMAAQTDHPRVVAVFALALQTVSEGLLREQFSHGDEEDSVQLRANDGTAEGYTGAESRNTEFAQESGSYDEIRQLLHSGAHAAALLVGLSESEQQQAIALSHDLARRWAVDRQPKRSGELQSLNHWGEALPEQWQALYQWLNHQHINGSASA